MAAFAATALLALFAALADANLTARGDLFLSFNGGIAPAALPRHTLAPISVHVSGTVRTLKGDKPPSLRRTSIELSRGGRLDTNGLPLCPISRVRATTTHDALAACHSSLVGHGRFTSRVAFPEETPFAFRGQILAFNSRVDGRHAILAHVYGSEPVPIARVIPFYLHSTSGPYGTVLTGSFPPSLLNYGYVKRISLDLYRVFSYRGSTRSYLSAACAAPKGLPGAVFPFARASMSFESGATLTSTVIRSCRVAPSSSASITGQSRPATGLPSFSNHMER